MKLEFIVYRLHHKPTIRQWVGKKLANIVPIFNTKILCVWIHTPISSRLISGLSRINNPG